MVTGSVIAGSALASAAFGYSSKKKAGKKAKKLTRKQEEFERFQLADTLRRLDIQSEQATGQQVAAAGATGFDIKSGSISRFLAEQKKQRQETRDFTVQQGERGVQITRQGGQNLQSAAKAGAIGSLVGGVGEAATGLSGGFANLQTARAANPNVKWWQS
jgi:hypothetical protein